MIDFIVGLSVIMIVLSVVAMVIEVYETSWRKGPQTDFGSTIDSDPIGEHGGET